MLLNFQDVPLREVAADVSEIKPIGMAVGNDVELGVYSYLSALNAEWMASGSELPILQCESENKETAPVGRCRGWSECFRDHRGWSRLVERVDAADQSQSQSTSSASSVSRLGLPGLQFEST